MKAGADAVAGITRERYINRLVWLRALSRFHIFTKRDDKQKLSFIRISNVLANLRLDASDGTVRKQPFCILLTGPPGCGKTGTAMRLAAHLMRARHGEFYSTDIVTMNETDEFQSEYRTNHKVVIFDDVGAENPNITTLNPWRKVIDFVNNIRKTALNPNLELKGNVYIEPELVIITTNLTTKSKFNTPFYMSCPDAIMRRLSRVAVLRPDFITCDVAIAEITNHKNNPRVYQAGLEFGDNQETQFISQFLEESVVDFIIHQEEQEVFVDDINSIFDTPNTSNNVLKAFFEDVVKPHWFKKNKLSEELIKNFSWFEKLGRLFCFEEGPLIMDSQSGIEFPPCLVDSIIQKESGRDLYLRENFDCKIFFILRDYLNQHTSYCPIPQGFANYHQPIILPSFITIVKDFYVEPIFQFSYMELEDEFDRRVGEYCSLSLSDMMDEDHVEQEEEFKPLIPDPQPLQRTEANIIKHQYSYENMTNPMKGFICNPLRDDLYMSEFLDAKPNAFKLVLREWNSSSGSGDFVFRLKHKGNIPLFVVVEIKSHSAEIAAAQSRKYGHEFHRQLNLLYDGDKMIIAIGLTPDSYTLFPITGTEAQTLEYLLKVFEVWFQNFKRCCGASRESNDSNEL